MSQILQSITLFSFILGTSASDIHFQAYLLDGLMRWNSDHSSAAVSSTELGPESYSGLLIHAVNELSEDVLGKKVKPNVQNIGIYTGEMIGVEYLFNQTGEILKDNTLVNEDMTQQEEEPLSDVNPDQIDEGFNEDEDETIAPTDQVLTVPLGNERGKCALSTKSAFPEFLTENVNLLLDSDAASTSDEDSAELAGSDAEVSL